MDFDFDFVDVCVHDRDHDGFCCAYFVWSRIDKRGTKGVDYMELGPSTVLEKEHYDRFEGKNVLVCDLSFSIPEINAIKQVAKSVLIIDHHKTAEEALGDLDCVVFDSSYAACGLLQKTYVEYLQKQNPLREINMQPTWLVAYTQDRDIWAWKLEDSKAVNAYLQIQPFDFELWEQLEHRMEVTEMFKEIVREGQTILDTQQRLCDEIAGYATLVDLYCTPEKESTVRARVVNCPVRELISMTGHTIINNEKEKPVGDQAKVAIMYTIFPDGGLLFSVRSDKDYDASLIAKAWGGGGHKSACGFKSKMENGLPWVVLNEPSVVK